MTRLLFTCAVFGAVTLAGCAPTPSTTPAPSGPPAGEATLTSLFGTWESTDSFTPAGMDPIEVQAFEGLFVEIGADRVIGLRGNRCDAPTFIEVGQTGAMPTPLQAGADEQFALEGLALIEIAVLCAGQGFDTFYKVDGTFLLTMIGDAVYRLDRVGGEPEPSAEAIPDAVEPAAPDLEPAAARRVAVRSGGPPEPMPAPRVEMAAMTVGTPTEPAPVRTPAAATVRADPAPAVQVAQAEPAEPGGWPRQAAHIASYRQVSDAELGWTVLAARHSALNGMTPMLVGVDLPGRGRFLRLMAVPPAEGARAALQSLCAEMRGAGNYCETMAVTAADGAVALADGAPPVVAAAPAVEPAQPQQPDPPPADPQPADPQPEVTEPAAEAPAADPAPAEDPSPEAEITADAADGPVVDAPEAAVVEAGPTPEPVEAEAPEAAEAPPPGSIGTVPSPVAAGTIPSDPPAAPADVEMSETGDAPVQEAQAEPEPVQTATAAAALTPSYLFGRWGFSDPVTGCSSADFIAFYPEGSVSLYDEMEGQWQIEDDMVKLHLSALDDIQAGGRRDIFLDMRVENVTEDQFQATFISAGESAAMAAYRCQ